jgi:type II secretion system protein N
LEILKSAGAKALSFLKAVLSRVRNISPKAALARVKSLVTGARTWLSNERNIDRVLTVLKYSAGGIVLFILFFYLYFPYDSLKSRIVESVEKAGGLTIELEKLSPSFVTGVELKNLRVFKDTYPDAPIVSIDEGMVRVGLLSLFRKSKDISFSSKLYAGSARGDMVLNGNLIDLKAAWDNLKLERYDLIGKRYGINLGGPMSGQVEFHGDRLKISEGKGTLKLTGAGLTLGETSLMGFIKIPPTNIKRLDAQFSLDNGKVGIPQMEILGDELSLSISGMVSFDKAAPKNSGMSLKVKVRPGPGLADDFAKFLATAQGFYPALANLKADSQGFYVFGVSGTFASPSLLDLSK